MAGKDRHPQSTGPLPPGSIVCLSPEALAERMEEEINRAGRHGIPLSCLLVVIENLDELTKAHGSELSAQALAYVARTSKTPRPSHTVPSSGLAPWQLRRAQEMFRSMSKAAFTRSLQRLVPDLRHRDVALKIAAEGG